MKKLKTFILAIFCIAIVSVLSGNSSVYAYERISSQTLFQPSTFDSLKLNYTSLPTLSVSGSQGYTITDGECGDGSPNRQITFNDTWNGKTLDTRITAFFNNCGTLNGRAIDMRLVYSEIVTSNEGSFLYWSAFGSQMKSSNEWWYNSCEHLKIDIYFYYHGESTPINFELGYLSIFSEDIDEGASSATSNRQYIYTTTNMAYASSLASANGSWTYHDVYYGTASGSTEAGSLNCVAFRIDSTDHMQVELYGLHQRGGIGYHLQYTPLTAVVPPAPTKSVDKATSQLNDTLTYNVRQQISSRYDSGFHYGAMKFTDKLNSNLTYRDLRVIDPNGNDITGSAGSVSFNSSTNEVTYTFNQSYLESMAYVGETYTFRIIAQLNGSSSQNPIPNNSTTTINNSFVLTSNTVNTTLKSKVITHHVNQLGVKIADDDEYNGDLLTAYTTAPKDIYGYYLVSNSGNTSGTMRQNVTEVTYYYDLICVNVNIKKTIDKTDSTVLNNLAGAVFKAENISFPGNVGLANPATVYTSSRTDASGNCVITGVPFGRYTVVESEIPSIAWLGQFFLNNGSSRITEFEIDINENKTYSYDLNDIPKKMNITIYKEDAETGVTPQGDATLDGATYGLYRDAACTDMIEELTIQRNADGTHSATSGWYLVGTYYVKETRPSTGYLIDETVYTVSQDPASQTVEYSNHSITSKEYVIRNHIEITKWIDETDSTPKQKLAGAVFTATLNSKPSMAYNSQPTNEVGYTIIEDLPYGTYTLKETTVSPTAYNAEFYVNGGARTTSFEQFVQLDKGTNAPYTYRDVNDVPKKMNITIFKEDEETGIITQGDATLDGAKYGIYRDEACTDMVEELTIAKNADGTHSATSGWYLVGTYYVKETYASTGYLIDKNVYKVEQDPAGQTTEYKSFNVTSKEEVIRNDIDITKYLEETDSTAKQKLAGATFTAQIINQQSPDKDKTYSATTDDNGHCVIRQLPYGTYRVWESNPPAVVYDATFYVQGSSTRTKTFDQFIELDDTQRDPYTYTDITDVAKKMKIIVQKQDDETGNLTQGDAHLEGAEYTFYRDEACTDAIETVTIQKQDDGTYKAESGWYLVGKYYVKETKAPEGYNIDERVYPVEQVPSEQVEEHSTHNVLSQDKVKEGIIRVIKYNNNSETSEKQPAVGSRIRLTLDSNPEVYYDAIINERGYADFIDTNDDHHSTTEDNCKERCGEFTIPYGRYTISEVYVSDAHENIFIDHQQTQITEQDEQKHYILDEEYVRLRLTINKIDSETGNVIPGGGTFKLWDTNRNEWYSEKLYPSGKFINEFTTDENGTLTINRHIEAGSYILYETQAPYGYYLDDDLRVNNTGYRFAIGVNNEGEVKVWQGAREVNLVSETITYDNMPTKMYSWTAVVSDPPQKAIIDLTDLAKQFTSVNEESSVYGQLNTPVYEDAGLRAAEFDVIAREDVYTEDGTKRYSKGQIVAHIITDENGKASTPELYLGDYDVVQTVTPLGYVPAVTVPVYIDYTNQYERVQHIPVNITNDKITTFFSFEKVFKELETSRFKIEDKRATFGIFAKEAIKNYRGADTIAQDELVEVIDVDENFKVTSKLDLPEGKYYVKEVDVSNPYILSSQTYDLTVEYVSNSYGSQRYTINGGTVENEAKTVYLELIVFPEDKWEENEIDKIEEEEELLALGEQFGIENKVYKVYNDPECTKPVMTIDDEEAMFETDINGTIKIPDMPTGIYYFKEYYAPYGYELSDEVIKAVVDGKSNVILKAKEPLKKCELLRKTDSFTKDVIPGVTYEITDSEEDVIYTGVTDENGLIIMPIVLFTDGETYYYQEVDGPAMYELEKDKVEFTASVDEECNWLLDTFEVSNNRKTIEKVIVKKTDSETGDPLEGCVFTIVLLDEEGNEYVNAKGETIYLVEEGTTNADGEYVIENVPYGTYRFTEIKAPEGYELDEDITGLEFTVDENSPDIIVFEVTNTGDIAVYVLVTIAILSTLGITFVLVKNKRKFADK